MSLGLKDMGDNSFFLNEDNIKVLQDVAWNAQLDKCNVQEILEAIYNRVIETVSISELAGQAGCQLIPDSGAIQEVEDLISFCEDEKSLGSAEVTGHNIQLKSEEVTYIVAKDLVEPQVKCQEIDITKYLEDVNQFDFAILLEANYLANAISNGSIAQLGDNESYMLDSTSAPEELSQVMDEVEPVKYDIPTVFKIVDEMILPPSSTKASTPSLGRSKSNTARAILDSLAQIFNNSSPTEEQKSKGRVLVSNLAEILDVSNSTNSQSYGLDDSDHSSICQPYQCSEVLDLRKKSCSETDIPRIECYTRCAPLDLSSKAKYETKEVTKFLPPKLSTQQRSLTSHSFLRSSSNFIKSNQTTPGFNTYKQKKGPLKAVIPLDDMSKQKSLMQSTHKHQKTPINGSPSKPVAQSTPSTPKTSRSPSASDVNKIKQPVQRLVRSYSADGSKLTFPNAFKPPKLVQKNSLSDCKTVVQSNTSRVPRFFSKKGGKENANK